MKPVLPRSRRPSPAPAIASALLAASLLCSAGVAAMPSAPGATPANMEAGAAAAPASAVKPAQAGAITISSLRFIGEQRLPWGLQFGGTLVGGLSGIDYDAARGDWVMICDDRSEHNAARYYRARLSFDDRAFHAVTLTGVTTLLQPDGRPYPPKSDFPAGGIVPDLETLRVDPRDGAIWYGSEGDVRLGLDPFVRKATPDGRFQFELPLPPLFHVDKEQKSGPRNNQAFEALSFTPDGSTLWVALEGPMYQDGAAPDPDRGAVNRITRFRRDGEVLGQYAYPLDAVPARPGKGRQADNGISEIVALSDTRLLAIERAGVQDDAGKYRNYVRLYEIDTEGATDIAQLPTLQGANYTMAQKRLVLDLNTLGLPVVDNLEGLAFGPVLPNGRRSLVLVSDDNFNRPQVMQFLLFEVTP